MKLSEITKFDIQAEAFRIMSGYMAPGKDPSILSQPVSYEEREAAYRQWAEIHSECVRAILMAFESTLSGSDEY